MNDEELIPGLILGGGLLLVAAWVTPLIACWRRRDRLSPGWGLLLGTGVAGTAAGLAPLAMFVATVSLDQPTGPSNDAFLLAMLSGCVLTLLGAALAPLLAAFALLKAWRACDELPGEGALVEPRPSGSVSRDAAPARDAS